MEVDGLPIMSRPPHGRIDKSVAAIEARAAGGGKFKRACIEIWKRKGHHLSKPFFFSFMPHR
jgi:hypothetical protein